MQRPKASEDNFKQTFENCSQRIFVKLETLKYIENYILLQSRHPGNSMEYFIEYDKHEAAAGATASVFNW